MYLHAGNGKNIPMKNIIGVFDMDSATVSKTTKDFLKAKEKSGDIEVITDELPKSFILSDDGKISFSQISVLSLMGRI